MKRTAARVALVAISVLPGQAMAETVGLVSLSSTSAQAWPEAESATRLELEAMGHTVVVVTRQSDGIAQERNAAVLLWISRAAAGDVELTVFEQATGTTTIKRMRGLASGTLPAAQIVALRAAEIINVVLSELARAHTTVPQTAPTTTELPAVAALPTMTVWGGLAGLHSQGKLADFWGPTIGALYTSALGLGVESDLFVSVSGRTLGDSEGLARLSLSALRLRGVLCRRLMQDIELRGGPELGMLFIRADGAAQSPLVAHDRSTFVVQAGATVGLSYYLVPTVALQVLAGVAAPWPRIYVRIGEQNVGRLSAMLVTGQLGARIEL